MASSNPPDNSLSGRNTSPGLTAGPGPGSTQGTSQSAARRVQSGTGHQSTLSPQSSGAVSNSPRVRRLGSTMRSTGDDYYKFEEMAKVLQDELENATYYDNSKTSLVLKVFPLHKIKLSFRMETLTENLRTYNTHRPLYLNEYFQDQPISPVQQRTPSAVGNNPSSVASSRATSVVNNPPSVASSRATSVGNNPSSVASSRATSVGNNPPSVTSSRATFVGNNPSSINAARGAQPPRPSPATSSLSSMTNYSDFYAFRDPLSDTDKEGSPFEPGRKSSNSSSRSQSGTGSGSDFGGGGSNFGGGGSSFGGGGPGSRGTSSQPPDIPELDDEQQFQSWFNHIAVGLDNQAVLQGRDASSRRFCADYSLTPMKGITPEKRKPDLVLISGEGLHPHCDGNWTSVWAVVEISREEDFKPRLMKELSQRAALIFHNSAGRRFVVILAISARQFMLSIFHRSGVTHSRKYDLVEDLHSLYFIITSFLFAEPETFGFDPNIWYQVPSMVPVRIVIWGKIYEIEGTLFVREGIQGRGTVCWRVRCVETNKVYMLKLSWLNLNRTYTEFYFYRKIAQRRIRGVPILYTVQDAPEKDDTLRWKPSDFNGLFVSRTCRKLLLDGVGRPITDFKSKRELLSATIDLAIVHKRLYDADILHRDMSLWNMFLIDDYPEYPDRDPFDDLDVTSGRHSEDPPSGQTPQPLFPSSMQTPSGAVAHSATGHVLTGQSTSQMSKHTTQPPSLTSTTASRPPGSPAATVSRPSSGSSYGVALFSSTTTQVPPRATGRALPHPGSAAVTARNTQPVDVFNPAPEKILRGLLADFDYAAVLMKISKEIAQTRAMETLTSAELQLRARTGTLPFMAIEVLLGAGISHNFFHTFQHDIESIIYDLMSICINYSGPRGRQRNFKESPLPPVYSDTARLPTEMWMSRDMTWVELGMTKVATWAHLEEWVLPSFHVYFDDMKDLFRDLANLLWPLPPVMDQRHYDRRVNCRVSYEDFIDVLRKYMLEVRG